MYEAAPESRNETAAATSAGSPNRPSGTLATASALRVSESASTSSVSIHPGTTVLTVTP